MKPKIKKKNALLWLFEPLEDDPRYIQRKLFSFDAAYLDGLLYVAVMDGKEPWSGLLVCTSRHQHDALLSESRNCNRTKSSASGSTSRSRILNLNRLHRRLFPWPFDAIQGSASNRPGNTSP